MENFKAHFTEILKGDFELTDKQIARYWKNKEKEEKYNEKKKTAICVGIGELVGTAGFAIYDSFSSSDCLIGTLAVGALGLLTTGVALVKRNPYKRGKYAEIDEAYEDAKEDYEDYGEEPLVIRKKTRR